MVGDGADTSNEKIKKAYTAISMMDQSSDVPISGRFALVYNKFSSKTGQMVEGIDIRNAGGAPVYANATCKQVAQQLMQMDMFDKLN